MATVPCDQIEISIRKGKELEALDELLKFGKLELIHQGRQDLAHHDLQKLREQLEAEKSLLETAKQILTPYLPKKSTLQSLEDDRVKLTEAEVAHYEKNKGKVLELSTTVADRKKRIDDIGQEILRLQDLINRLSPYKDLDAPIFGDFAHLFFRAFTIPAKDRAFIEAELGKISQDLEIFEIWKNEEHSSIIVAGPKEFSAEVEKAITDKAQLFTPDKTLKGSFKSIVKESAEQVKKLEDERLHLEKALKKDAARMSEILVLHDLTAWDLQKIGVQDAFEAGDETYRLKAWIDPRHLEPLKRVLKDVDPQATVQLEKDIAPDEKKVTLRNSGLNKDFETVTKTMGYPTPGEIDPTPLVTPFFILFFGQCLSDAGYGLVLSLVSGALLLMVRNMKAETKHLMKIIFYCSLSVIFFGAIEGSWFGFVPDYYVLGPDANWFQQLINPLVDFMKWAMIIDPTVSISLMLGILLGVGITHMFIGFFTNFLAKVKQGAVMAGILDDLVTALMLLSIALYGLSMAIPSLSYLTIPLQWSSLSLFVLLILAQGRSVGLLGMIPLGLLKTFMVLVGFLGESLSYTRLLPLGISTGIIAGVVNLLAFLTAGVPYVGPLIVIVILIGGHTVNILLNLLSAYITSNRLHFVEFFPKFMSGAGKPLMPFRRLEQHVVIAS